MLEEDRTRSWFCRVSGFSLVEGNGRTFPPEGKAGARLGQEDGVWMAGRAEKATEDVCLEERSRGWVGVARMRSGKISELGGGLGQRLL